MPASHQPPYDRLVESFVQDGGHLVEIRERFDGEAWRWVIAAAGTAGGWVPSKEQAMRQAITARPVGPVSRSGIDALCEWYATPGRYSGD